MKIELQNLTQIYGLGLPYERKALDNINVTIDEGEFIGLIGHTGSGKSTFVQHLNGLLKPHSGKILLNDVDMWEKGSDIRSIRFKVGLVFQYPEHQLFEETVYNDIAFGPKNMGLDEQQIKNRVLSAMDFVDLTYDLLDKSPFELSGGQKRKVAIAGVIAMQPEVLVLDEPTAGLDPRARDDLLLQIKKYHIEKKSTVILVSHNMEDVAKTVDKILVMNDGGIEKFNTVKEIFDDYKSLISIGLDVPMITKVFNDLKEKGIKIDTSIYTVKYATEHILKMLGRGE